MRRNIASCGILDVFCPRIVYKSEGRKQPEAREALKKEKPQKSLGNLTDIIWLFLEKGTTGIENIKQCAV